MSAAEDTYPEPWVLHDHPERDHRDGIAYACDCRACAIKLQAVAVIDPGFPWLVRCGNGRAVATAEALYPHADDLAAWLGFDYVRDVSPPADRDLWRARLARTPGGVTK